MIHQTEVFTPTSVMIRKNGYQKNFKNFSDGTKYIKTHPTTSKLLTTELYKCDTCKRQLSPTAFHEDQLSKLAEKTALESNSVNQKSLTCNKCSIKPQRQRQCYGCDKLLNITQFSKAQIKNAKEEARCFKCVKEFEEAIEVDDFDEDDFSFDEL